jgi:hypothetical protein
MAKALLVDYAFIIRSAEQSSPHGFEVTFMCGRAEYRCIEIRGSALGGAGRRWATAGGGGRWRVARGARGAREGPRVIYGSG